MSKRMHSQVGAAVLTWDTIEDTDGVVITGLSGVEIMGVPLMDSSFPSRFILQGPDGWDYRTFRYLDTVRESDVTVIRTEAIGTQLDSSWYRDQYDHDILCLGRPRETPRLEVDFLLSEANEDYRDVAFTGFTLGWRFRSPDTDLGRLRWHQHWEIGGSALGSTVYWQSQIASPVHTFTRESSWNNVCWKSLLKGQQDRNVSMQLNARVAYHQLFDLLRGREGVFLGYFAEAQCVQMASCKSEGEENYHLVESLEFPLARTGSFSGKTILFSPTADMSEASVHNLWFDVNAKLEESYRIQTGIKKSRVLPTYTHDMLNAAAGEDHLYFDPHRTGERIPAERYLEWLGEHEMPLAKKNGFRRFWTRPYCISDTSEYMFWNKSMRGGSVMDGDVSIGSCCCVWEYKPSAMYGGGEMAKRFYELGHAAGLDVGIWVGNHLSPRSPIIEAHPEWILKDRNFANPTGGYSKDIMTVVDWNSPVRDWILQDLIAWKERYGLDFIFFDSLGNLGLKTRNYASSDLADNFCGLTRFIADVTQAGIEVICEGRSFLGAPHFAICNDANTQSDADPLIGQNSLDWFRGNENMFFGIEAFGDNNPNSDVDRLVTMNFRTLAGGGLFNIHDGPEALDDQRRLYNRIAHLMQKRTVLEDEKGVLWNGASGEQIFFSFRDGALPLDGTCSIRRVTPDGLDVAETMSQLEAEPNAVYLISSPASDGRMGHGPVFTSETDATE